MIDTNDRPDNEQWLFDALQEMEELGCLDAFCRQAGIEVPGGPPLVEGVWPLVRARYSDLDGVFDISGVCRDLLAFPPMIRLVANIGKVPGGA